MSELPGVRRNAPYLIGFAVLGVTQQSKVPGPSGELVGLPPSVRATFSPIPENKWHWSVSGPDGLQDLLNGYGKTFRNAVIIANPFYEAAPGKPHFVEPVQ
jgi:hypothetical protein